MPPWRLAKNIGARLRDLRVHLGWGQEELGHATGRRVQAVSAWETGKTEPPRSVLERLAQQLKTPIEMFAEGGPMPSKVVKPSTVLRESGRRPYDDAEGPVEGAGWLWEDPRESEERFRDYIRNVERSVRGMVGDPDQVKLRELRLVAIDLARISARSAGRQVPEFVQTVENEIVAGTFR